MHSRTIAVVLWLLVFAVLPLRARATDYFVGLTGKDDVGYGLSSDHPFATIMKAINETKPGDTVHIAAGIYREQVTIYQQHSGTTNDRITIDGAGMGATIIDGSDALPQKGWANCGNGLFRLALPDAFKTKPIYRFDGLYCETDLPEFARQSGPALPATDERANDPAYACRTDAVWQLADIQGAQSHDQRLRWAPHPLNDAQAPLPVGTYFINDYDTTGQQYHPTLAMKTARDSALCAQLSPSDPPYSSTQSYLYVRPYAPTTAGGTTPPALAMTTAARAHPFVAYGDYGTLRNVTVRRAASDFLVGAVFLVGNYWTFDHVEVRENALEGLHANRVGYYAWLKGDLFHGIEIRNSQFIENGMVGLAGGYLTNGMIEQNEVAYNNWQHWSMGDAGAGAKFPGPEQMIFRNNFFHHNYGPGLWFDTFGSHTTILDNIFFGNFARQLHLELVGPSKASCGADECCADTTCTGPECAIRVEGNVFAGNYFNISGGQSEPVGGVLIRSSRMTHLQDNLFVGNNIGLYYQPSTSICFRLGGNHATNNMFVGSSAYHLVNGGGNFQDPLRGSWCVENSLAGWRDGVKCAALGGMWAAICDPPRTDCDHNKYPTSELCESLSCLVSDAGCFDDPAPYKNPALSNDFDQNQYTTQTMLSDVGPLFTDLPEHASDIHRNTNPSHDWIYSWAGAYDPSHPELYQRSWTYQDVVAMRAKSPGEFLDTGHQYDHAATYRAPGVMVHHTTMPLSYTAPTSTSDVSLGHIHLFRLGAVSGNTLIKVTTAVAEGSTPSENIQVRLNGRPLTGVAASATLFVGSAMFSPWENWITVATPPSVRLRSVHIGGNNAACPIMPPQSSDTTCDGIDDDCDEVVDEDAQPTPITCGTGSCQTNGFLVCQNEKIVTQCSPLDPLTELCGDGIDQDCNGSDLSCPTLPTIAPSDDVSTPVDTAGPTRPATPPAIPTHTTVDIPNIIVPHTTATSSPPTTPTTATAEPSTPSPPQSGGCGLIMILPSPHRLDRILGNRRVGGDDRNAEFQCLANQDTVKWISMERR